MNKVDALWLRLTNALATVIQKEDDLVQRYGQDPLYRDKYPEEVHTAIRDTLISLKRNTIMDFWRELKPNDNGLAAHIYVTVPSKNRPMYVARLVRYSTNYPFIGDQGKITLIDYPERTDNTNYCGTPGQDVLCELEKIAARTYRELECQMSEGNDLS